MLIQGTNHQPRFGMWHFDMPKASNAEEKARQLRVLRDMCDTFKKTEGAQLYCNPAFDFLDESYKRCHFPASVDVDNTTAEESILGRIQVFLSKRGFNVNPFEGEMIDSFDQTWKSLIRTPSPQTTQVNKRQRRDDFDRMDVAE